MTEPHETSDTRRRRSVGNTEQALGPADGHEQLPGGAEGGDESPSADKPAGLPADDGTPLGDTDQHSSP